MAIIEQDRYTTDGTVHAFVGHVTDEPTSAGTDHTIFTVMPVAKESGDASRRPISVHAFQTLGALALERVERGDRVTITTRLPDGVNADEITEAQAFEISLPYKVRH